jgi:hypothetical protein
MISTYTDNAQRNVALREAEKMANVEGPRPSGALPRSDRLPEALVYRACPADRGALEKNRPNSRN